MKYRILLFLAVMSQLPLAAQTPSWVKKASQAVFTLKTFNADGTLLASRNGFFIGSDGVAMSEYTPFKGAASAIVIDANGKEWPVSELLGANGIYDVARFRISGKVAGVLSHSSANANTDAKVWVLPYGLKKSATAHSAIVSRRELFDKNYAYYTLSKSMPEQFGGSPVLDDNGSLIAILQTETSAQQNSFAVSALFVDSLRLTGLSLNSGELRQTAMPIAIPEGKDDAIVSLFIAASVMDTLRYADYIGRFIRQYPKLPDGYISLARLHVSQNNYQQADDDLQQALRVAERKDDISYQQAQILFTMQRYDEAAAIFTRLAQKGISAADNYYNAAQCNLQKKDTAAYMALTDSALATFQKPYPRQAAPYLLARAQTNHDMRKYRLAVSDYNEYASIQGVRLTAAFYFQREQAEMAGRLYQQALDDIKQAISIDSGEYTYRAEKACVELRVGLLDDAISTATECIAMNSEESDGYLFLGLAQCLKRQTAEGLENLRKAQQLGNPQAEPLIAKYGSK